ncbi:MAG: hypothetical protein FJ308_13410 [Planctomycetes bacterium]|nr:hypothetical protein [Planctomycetota bacterium]
MLQLLVGLREQRIDPGVQAFARQGVWERRVRERNRGGNGLGGLGIGVWEVRLHAGSAKLGVARVAADQLAVEFNRNMQLSAASGA